MILSSDTFTSIAKDLSRSKEAQRAKKLVFYVSQRYWENDINVVESSNWEELLKTLYENNPTIDDLKALLYHAVNTLNRKEVYVKIARYILKRMSELYVDSGYSKEDEDNESSVNQFDHELIDRIVERLNYHEESPRMKKLIFAACKQYWENDINVIEMYDMRELLLEIRQLYSNPKKLKKALDNIVATINRQNFYSFIADTIVAELAFLYKYEPPSSNADSENEEEQEETRLILGSNVKKSQNTVTSQNISKETQITSDFTPQIPPPSKKLDNSSATSDTTTVRRIVHNKTADNTTVDKTITDNTNVPEAQIIPWLKVDNLFDLKQEIMQYTNPLRAKIMLFYAIYQISPLEQHWSIVRTCTLDDLLIRMFQHYGKNIQQIESHLNEIAKLRIEGLEPDDNLQAVSAIVESIKHFYKKR